MAIDANGPAWRQLIQGAVAAERTAITRGEVLVTALDALGPNITIRTETAMTSAFVIFTGLTIRFTCFRRLGRGAIGWLI
jgi:hypothetical protein